MDFCGCEKARAGQPGAGGRQPLSLPGKQVVGMDGKDIPIDADGGVVPTLGLFENLPGSRLGQAGSDLSDIVNVPRNLDGIDGLFAAVAHV